MGVEMSAVARRAERYVTLSDWIHYAADRKHVNPAEIYCQYATHSGTVRISSLRKL